MTQHRMILLALFLFGMIALAGLGLASRDDFATEPAGLGTSRGILSDAALRHLDQGLPARHQGVARPVSGAYDAILRHAFVLAADPDLVVLRDGAFDPLKGLPTRKDLPLAQALPPQARTRIAELSETRVQLLQFTRPVDENTLESLRRDGFDPVGYIPNNAFLVRFPAGRESDLDSRPDLRWRGELPWTHKLDPTLAASLRSGVGQDSVLVQVAGYPGETPEEWETLAEMLGTEEILYSRDHERTPRLMLRVPAHALRDVAAGLAQVPGVENVRLFEVPVRLNSGSIWLLQSGDPLLKSTPLFDAGLTGWGQIYAAVDSGLDTDGCQFRYDASPESQTLAQKMPAPRTNISDPDNKVIAYYVLTGAEAYDESSGGYHGTQTTGCAVGDNYANLATRTNPGIDHADGMAPAAKIVFQDAATITGYLYGLAFETQYNISLQAYNSGARVHNNSYGLQNPSVYYDQDSQQLDDFSWEKNDYTIVFAAGNSGPREQTLGGEGGTSKNTLVVGASMPGWWQDGKDMVYFSSRGPTADMRLKPDIMAPGVIESATEMGGERIQGKVNVYGQPVVISRTDPPNNQCGVSMTTGTSFASPTAAGMAILARQYFTDGFYPSGKYTPEDGFIPTSALIRAVTINSTRNMTGDVIGFNSRGEAVSRGAIDPAPSSMQGWGLITLADALHLRGDRRNLEVFADIPNGQEETLATGDVADYEIYVKRGMPFKVTLAWIDPPGNPGSGRILVNDLDLEVTSPQGSFYRGNVNITSGTSRPVDRSEASDTLNPQEQVIVTDPEEGIWKLRVRAADVPGNGRNYPHASNRQGYALIATGDLGPEPSVLFPRITARFEGVSGGCDGDISLDKNEVVNLNLMLLNSGDGASGPLRTVLSLDEEGSTLPLEWVVLPHDGISNSPPVPAKNQVAHTLQVGLGEVDINIFDLRLALKVDIYTQDGEWLNDLQFTIVTGVDVIEDGSVIPQRMECSPPASLEAVEPTRVFPGQSGFSMTLRGSHMKSDIAVRFVPDVFSYDSAELIDPTQLVLKRVRVSQDAEEGPVAVYVQNPEELETSHSGLLEVFIPEVGDDGDVDEEDPADGDDTPQPKVSGGGCNSLPPDAGASLLVLLLGLALLHRRRRADGCNF